MVDPCSCTSLTECRIHLTCQALRVARVTHVVRCVFVERNRTHLHALGSGHKQEGLRRRTGSAGLAVGGVEVAGGALGVAGVAQVVGAVGEQTLRTGAHARGVAQQEGLVQAVSSALLAVCGAEVAQGAAHVAGVAGVSSGVLEEGSGTGRETGRRK